jgi:hypothetical protein
MPLNQSQRNEIEISIAHFFYGLPDTNNVLNETISSIRAALEKPLPALPEQKEAEEKHNSHETQAFTQLTQIISETESVLKGLEDRNPEKIQHPTTLNEVKEYIIFYSICCLLSHMEYPNSEDDFKINDWLISKGVTELELAGAWQLQAYLTKVNATTLLAQRWDITATFNRLQQQPEKPFKTYIPTVDYGSYNFNWDLPALTNRMYRAEIKERWTEIKNKQGRIIEIKAAIDLHIEALVASTAKIEITLPNFKPYPLSIPPTRAALAEVDAQLNTQVFSTPAKKATARRNAIARLNDAQLMKLEDKIKSEAINSAEKEAIKLITPHLERLANIAAEQREQLLAAHEESPSQDAIDNIDMEDARILEPDTLQRERRNRLTIEIPSSPVLNTASPFSFTSLHQPPNSLSDMLQYVDSDAETEYTDYNEPMSSSQLSPLRNDNDDTPAVFSPIEIDEEKSDQESPPEMLVRRPRTSTPIAASQLRSEQQAPPQAIALRDAAPLSANNPQATGCVLVTHAYYYEEILAGRMHIPELQKFSPSETQNLASLSVMSLLKNGMIDKAVAVKLKPGIKKLLGTPTYFRYLQQYPHAFNKFIDISLEDAIRISTPFVTNLLDRKIITLDYLLETTREEAAIMATAVYGELFYRVPTAIALIKGITAFEKVFLLNDTVRSLIEKSQLTIDEARQLANNLMPFQLDLLLDKTCQHLFSEGIPSSFANITPEKATNLRDPKINALIECGVIPADIGMNLNAQTRSAYTAPLTHKLLLEKALTPAQVLCLSPQIRRLLENEPYATALANQPEFLSRLQQWTEEKLERFFAPTIIRLFRGGVICLDSLNDRTTDFFSILYGNNICNLLLDGKITLKQALNLTPITWTAIETRIENYQLLNASNNNDQLLDYIPFTLWSHFLKNRLLWIYHGNPQYFDNTPDTTDIINAQINLIAINENLSRRRLKNQVVELVLQGIREDIQFELRNVPENRIPKMYDRIIAEIRKATQSSHPDWLTTLTHVADHAEDGLTEIRRSRFRSAHRHASYHQHIFDQPMKITPQGVRDFCHNIRAILTLHIHRLTHSHSHVASYHPYQRP